VPAFDNELAQIVADLNRAAPGSRAPDDVRAASTASLDEVLMEAAGRGASDILL